MDPVPLQPLQMSPVRHGSCGKRYRGSAFTCATVPAAVDELHDLGLLDSKIAYPGSRGRQSRLRATAALIDAARPALVLPPAGAPTVIYDPKAVIRLKDADGNLIDYGNTRRTDAMRRQMREINKSLRATDVDLPAEGASREGPFLHLGDAVLNQAIDVMHRVFSRASFSLHGRLYGPWWRRSTRPGSTSRSCTRCTMTGGSQASRRCRRSRG